MSRIASIVASSNDLDHEDVTVSQWNNVVIRITSMDLAHRGAYLERIVKAREEQNDVAMAQLQAELLVHSAFDPEDNSQAFDLSDIPMLLTKHGGVVGRLSAIAQRLSGLDADAEERLGKDSLASTETPSDVSTSNSPES